MYSALKHQGQPLYKLARQGLEIEREARTITVHQLDLVDQKEDTLSLDVRCSKGTYIRTLVEDIGAMLGCGAHVIYLRRMSVAPYLENKMVSMQDLQAAHATMQLSKYLLPADSALAHLSALTLTSSAAFYLKRGQSVLVSKSPAHGLVRLYTESGDFLGVGEMQTDGKIAPKRLVSVS
jgi:tRNA pseudouridine55 synthase